MITDKMYQLDDRYRNLEALLEDETVDENAIVTALENLKADITEKSEQYLAVLRRLDIGIKSLDSEIKRLQAIKKRAESGKEFNKFWLKRVMETMGVNELGEGKNKIRLQKNGGKATLIVDRPELIPAEYMDVIPEHYELNKDALREVLGEDKPLMVLDKESGMSVVAAHLERGMGVRW